jgi:hypothetical protein
MANNRAICDRYHSEGKAQRLQQLGSTTKKGDSMARIILKLVAALAITIGAFAIGAALDDSSSTTTMLALPLVY